MIRENEECELVALCDVKPKEVLGIDEFPTPFFDNIETLLAQGPPADVVCICTPNALHAAQSIKTLEHRRHVVVEKPMALHKADCERIIFKALNVSRQVFCVMQNRYSPSAAWLKKIVEHGRLGKILMVQVNCFWNRDDRYYFHDGQHHEWHGKRALDGGILFTQFAHFIDLLYWIFGDITNIRAQLANFLHGHSTDFEDSGIAQFDFVNGGMGSLCFSTAIWDKNFESTLSVVGTKGSVKLGGQYMNQLEYCHIEGLQPPTLPEAAPPNQYGPYQGSAANHHFVIQNVVDVLKGRKEATTNALEGMKVVEMIERIYDTVNSRP